MTFGTISNSENGLSVRQKLNSGLSALNNFAILDQTNEAKFSYIDPLKGSNSGDGSLAFPFRTADAAYNAGARTLFIYPGNAGTINLSTGESDPVFWIYGFGASNFFPSDSSTTNPFSQGSITSSLKTQVLIKNDNATTDHLHIYSNGGVTISLSGVASSILGAGIEAAVYNAVLGDVTLRGENGTNGAVGENGANGGTDENGGNGTVGGDGIGGGVGGILYLGCSTVIGNINLNGGNGGAGGAGGSGGDAGPLDVNSGGNGGNGGDGGVGGSGGDGGNLVSHYSRILGSVSMNAGSLGVGGTAGIGGALAGDGSNGTDGSVGADGSNGRSSNVYTAFSMFSNGISGSPNVSHKFSVITGYAQTT